jgi:DNA-binding response OmpR family regulator
MSAQGGALRHPVACRVVLVEDHPLLRRRFTDQLLDDGLAVVAAVSTCAAGLAAVRDHGPTVVVVDSRLVDGRGVELCRTVRGETPHVVMLLHARLVSAAEEQEALAAGVAAVVPKGIRGRALVSAVRAHGLCRRPAG